MRPWLLLGCVGLVTGCAEPQSGTYAVTLTDALTIDCIGYADGLLADADELAELAKDARKAWKKARAATPPTPEGRTLHINELEVRSQSWFEGASQTPAPVPSPWEEDDPRAPAPDDVDGTDTPRFDDPAVVYEGAVQTDFVEGTYADRFNTDEADEEAGLLPCGERYRVRGTLSLTTSGGITGRIRWTNVIYVPSDYWACEGRIECARDITVEGLEIE